MLDKENEEENKLIDLEEYYSNFFYKNKKFKQTMKSKILDSREYFSQNPKIQFGLEILLGLIFFGFPMFYLIHYTTNKDHTGKLNFFSFKPLLIISFISLIITIIMLGLKIRRILGNGLYLLYYIILLFFLFIYL